MCAASDLRTTSRSQDRKSGVSVVIPVYNASATLDATIHSLVAQTYSHWEAIIIDDGSTDGTNTIVEKWVRKDARIRAFHQENSGVSAARNRGLSEARHSYVLFLDGDDRLGPRHLCCMVGKLTANRDLDAVHCGWQCVLPSGIAGRVHLGPTDEDLFEHFAAHCEFALNACVLKREVALAAGEFDPSHSICADWDFFQRVARIGARFGLVPQPLAFYHLRPNSMSQDNLRSLTESQVVIARGHTRDPRVRTPAKAHTEGRNPGLRYLALYYAITYFAAKEIATGHDARHFLEFGDDSIAPNLLPAVVSDIIQEMVPMGVYRSENDWAILWSQFSAPVSAFVAALEDRTCVPGLAYAVLQNLQKAALVASPARGPILIGNSLRTDIEVGKPIGDVLISAKADRLICRLMERDQVIGISELPALGAVSGQQIAKAAVSGNAQAIMRRGLSPVQILTLCVRTLKGLMRRRTLRLMRNAATAKPGELLKATLLLKQELINVAKVNLPYILARRAGLAARRVQHQWQERLKEIADAGGTLVRSEVASKPESQNQWDRLFALPDPWGYDSEYEVLKYERTLALLPEVDIEEALEFACAEGHFTTRLAARVKHLTAADISSRALARAQARCASTPNVTFRCLDLERDQIPGPFDLIVCSEVLYFVHDVPETVARILAQVRPGGFFLTAHARLVVDDPEGVGFDWGHPFGVETISKAIASIPGVALCREVRTPLYRILLYQRQAPDKPIPAIEVKHCPSVGLMTPAAERRLGRGGSRLGRGAAARTYSVPILMYHRIATDGPPGLKRRRVSPELFDAHMNAIYRAGYQTITLAEWADAVIQLRPVRGKRVLLTFDDGYRDFLTGATPILRPHGFSATMFLVAERIGKTALWDSAFGDCAPLMTWEEIRVLQEIGIEFGAHSTTHWPMTGMGFTELTEDNVRARAILEEGLGVPVPTLAYPYGAQNEFVRRVVGDIGFMAGVTTEPGISKLGDDPLRLPRIEIAGDCTPEQLISLLEHPD